MTRQEIKFMVWSFVRVFFAASLAQYISLGKDMFSIDTETWKSIAGSGISALVLVAYNFFNKNDPRYGPNKDTEIVEK